MERAKRRIDLWLLMAWTVFAASPAARADISIGARLDKTVIREGDASRLFVQIKADGGESLASPVLPEIEGLEFLFETSGRGTNITMANGRMTSVTTLELRYQVLGLREGEYEIAGIRAAANGQTVEAGPIKLTVLAGQAPTPTPAAQTGAGASAAQQNPFGILFVCNRSKEEVYVGEELMLEYVAYFPLTVTRLQLDDRKGQFQNFWTETYDMMDERYHEQQVLNGRRYLKVPIRRYFLFPLTAGEHTIEPLNLVCEVIPDQFRNFRFFFGGNGRKTEVSSPPVTVNVKPLPEEGRPEIFDGAVGQFTLQCRAETTQISEGDPVTLEVVLKGLGNIRNAPKPRLPALERFDEFDPTKEENIQVNLNGVSGEIVYHHVLVPHDAAANVIGPAEYAYFDPAEEKYVTLRTGPIQLEIAASQRPAFRGAPGAVGGRRMITRVGEDFRFISVSPAALSTVNLALYQRASYWAVLFAPALVLAAAWGVRRRMRYFADNPGAAKSRKAPRLAVKLLAGARDAIRGNDPARAYAALSKAVTDFIGHRWNLAAAGMTSAELRAALEQRGIGAAEAERVVRALDEFDGARFSGAALDEERMNADYAKTQQLIQDLMRRKA